MNELVKQIRENIISAPAAHYRNERDRLSKTGIALLKGKNLHALLPATAEIQMREGVGGIG